MTPEFIEGFQKDTGIAIELSVFSSNEELLAKLQAGASGYDVALPSDYMVAVMRKLGLLESLDLKKIPSLKDLDPRFLRQSFDPKNQVSVPFDWGSTGIAVNRDLYSGKLEGWNDLFTEPKLKGKFTLLDDAREAIGAALKSSGLSLNSMDPKDLAQAKSKLMTARSNVKAFTSETMNPLMQGEVAAAQAFVSDTLLAQKKSGRKIEFIIPKEGATLWIDNLVIPKGAKHIEQAHRFIEAVIRPDSQARTVQAVFVSPCHPGAIGLLPPNLRSHPSLFPSQAEIKRLERIDDLGEGIREWNRVWTEVKANAG
jgi:spermidine/putrescine transport system substrate-binding protein